MKQTDTKVLQDYAWMGREADPLGIVLEIKIY